MQIRSSDDKEARKPGSQEYRKQRPKKMTTMKMRVNKEARKLRPKKWRGKKNKECFTTEAQRAQRRAGGLFFDLSDRRSR